MDRFDRKYLVYCQDGARSNFWAAQLTKVGLLETVFEMQNVNIIPKLQDKTYDACILIAQNSKSLGARLSTVMASIRNNPLASLVPIVVIDQDAVEQDKVDYYENGANYVMNSRDYGKGAVEICYILENLLNLVEKYRVDKRFYR
jgi:hypothetical protein